MSGTKGRSGGRNRKAVQLHVLRGTFQPSRHGDVEPSPEPPAGTPSVRGLKGEARAEWDRMIARLENLGTLSTVDDAALRRYVKLHAETEGIEAEHARLTRLAARLTNEASRLEGAQLVEAISAIVALEKVQVRLLPQLRQGSMALRQWLVEFGLTPASRTRVTPRKKPATAADPKKAKYLNALA